MKKIWSRGILGGLMAAALCVQVTMAAAQAGEILGFGTEDKNIVLYIQNPGEEYQIQCQIGTGQAEKIEMYPIVEDPIPMETIILLDNSLSVVEKYRPMIRTIMSELAANRMHGEQFTVAVFSDQIQYLVKDCADYSQVRQAIDGITYNNQETYLTDVLYNLLTDMNKEKSTALKRIVIISDGVDNKSIGYTKEELYDVLNKNPYPIFTLGCTYKNNNEQLKNMFALSRMTGGESWLLDDVADPMTVVNGVSSLNHAVKVVVTPRAKDCDGTRKGVNLIVQSGNQEISDSVEMVMPFITIEETAAAPTTAVPVPTVSTMAAVEETIAVVAEPQQESGVTRFLMIGGCVLVVALLAGTFIYLRQRQEEKNRFVAADSKLSGNTPEKNVNQRKRTTSMAGVDGASGHATMYVWEETSTHTLILEDISNPVRRFEVALDSSILVGYDADCQIRLNYEETVSGRHCRIYGESGRIYVENLSRSNGTYMDGKKVIGSAEIYTGCVLRLGKLSMKVEIR